MSRFCAYAILWSKHTQTAVCFQEQNHHCSGFSASFETPVSRSISSQSTSVTSKYATCVRACVRVCELRNTTRGLLVRCENQGLRRRRTRFVVVTQRHTGNSRHELTHCSTSTSFMIVRSCDRRSIFPMDLHLGCVLFMYTFLSSSDSRTLLILHVRACKTFGHRSVYHAAPSVWNSRE